MITGLVLLFSSLILEKNEQVLHKTNRTGIFENYVAIFLVNFFPFY